MIQKETQKLVPCSFGLAYKSYQTVYQKKHGLLSNYLIEQLKHPALPMSLV
jgi:hypothetical protein